MSTQKHGFIGKGQIYLRRLDAAHGLKPIGEASAFELSIETDQKTLPSNTQPGGGVAAVAYAISSMKVSITGHDLDDDMVAMALYGEASQSSGGAVTDEVHAAFKGCLVPFASVPDKELPISVTDDGGSAYAVGQDYIISSAGVKIVPAGNIADNSTIKVSYSAKPQSAIEMLTNSGYEYELFFEGYNDADLAAEFDVNLYRVKFGATSGLGFIQDDFAENSLEGECLIDSARPSSPNMSKFGMIRRV